MKAILKTTAALLFAAAALVSCTREESRLTPQPAAEAREAAARYLVPLTTGRPNGERAVVDSVHALGTNVAELRPVLRQIIRDARAGSIPTHPDDMGGITSYNPQNYLQQTLSSIAQSWRTIDEDEMLVDFEMEYGLMHKDGHTTRTARSIDLISVDKDDMMPDRVLCRIYMTDLGGYSVQSGGQSRSLQDYLSGHAFEQYVIRVYGAQDTFGLRDYTNIPTIQAHLDNGHFDGINPY